MAEIESLTCCGLKEISGITGYRPESILEDICQEWFDDTPRAFMVFSTTRGSASGKNLAAYIKEKKLGHIYKLKPKLNRNSGNILCVWVWAVNNPGLKSLALKKGWYERSSTEDEW